MAQINVIRGPPGPSGLRGPPGPSGVQGPSTDIQNSFIREDVSAQIGNRNTLFILNNTPISGTLKVEWNGLVQKPQSIVTSGNILITKFKAYSNNSLIAEYFI